VLHNEEYGRGDPILFIPGLQASTRYWGDVSLIADRRRVLLADLLGFGRSPWPMNVSYSLDDHLEWLRRTVVSRGADRNLTIVAHSFGTIVAAHYAAMYGDEIQRLFLLGAPLFDSREEARERIRKMSSIAALFSLNRFVAREGCMVVCAFRPMMMHIAPLLRPDLPAEVAEDAMLHHWPSIRGAIQILQSTPLAPALQGAIGPRTTFVHGRRDGVTPIEKIHAVAKDTGASVIEVPGGHQDYVPTVPSLLSGVRRPDYW
jgi:pimeloyl-ACP methyl ester carboxylesterase